MVIIWLLYGSYMVIIWLMMVNNLVGGIPTPLKNDGVRQLGWWNSQLNGKIKNDPNHQPVYHVFQIVLRFVHDLFFSMFLQGVGSSQMCPRFSAFVFQSCLNDLPDFLRPKNIVFWLHFASKNMIKTCECSETIPGTDGTDGVGHKSLEKTGTIEHYMNSMLANNGNWLFFILFALVTAINSRNSYKVGMR